MARSKGAARQAATSAKGTTEERPKDAPFPPSAANELRDNAVPASEIAAATSPAAPAADTAKSQAATTDAVNEQLTAKEEADRKEEDESLFGRINRSGIFFVEDQVSGERYFGPSPMAGDDPSAKKIKVRITPLTIVPPRKGFEVRLAEGESFTLGEEYGSDATPMSWAGVINPNSKKPLFA